MKAGQPQVPVAPVEAGLRSFDKCMREAINRLLTDTISDLLFTSEEGVKEARRCEGHAVEQVCDVSNVTIDSLRLYRRPAEQSTVLDRLGLTETVDYAVRTEHRENNVDVVPTLAELLSTLADLAHDLPVIFPRIRARLQVIEFTEEEIGEFPVLASCVKSVNHTLEVPPTYGSVTSEGRPGSQNL